MPDRQGTSSAEAEDEQKLPPHSLESEAGVLGCVFLSPTESLDECESRKLPLAAFYDLRHRAIYAVFLSLYRAGRAIDLITVQQRLKDAEELDGVGGLAYLSSLPDQVPSAANLPYYLETVFSKYALRQLIAASTVAVREAYDFDGDNGMEVVERTSKALQVIGDSGVIENQRPVKDLVHAAINKIEEQMTLQGAPMGIRTGFPDIDRLTNGLMPADMIIIAGRPSSGKTSIAMNIVEHVALDEKLPVGVFSLEMDAESLIMRMLCSRARVNLRNLSEHGHLSEASFPRMTAAAGKIANSSIFIDDGGELEINQFRARARKMHVAHGIKLFVVDYLQLLSSPGGKSQNRQQEVSDISAGLKATSKELRVPIIVLSQLSRGLETDKSPRKPKLSDLRESGSIEQDADKVLMLYKADPDNVHRPAKHDAEDNGEVIPVNALLAKNRNGIAGVDLHLTFLKTITRFESAARISPQDVPPQ